MNRLPSPRTSRFDIHDRIISTRASLVARVRLCEPGLANLWLPKAHFSSSIEMQFTPQELKNAVNLGGLIVPTYDDRGRIFDVEVLQTEDHYILGGENGWNKLVRFNDLRKTTIITLWIYRERMKLGPIMQLPRFLVRVEDREQLYCSECKRRCRDQALQSAMKKRKVSATSGEGPIKLSDDVKFSDDMT